MERGKYYFCILYSVDMLQCCNNCFAKPEFRDCSIHSPCSHNGVIYQNELEFFTSELKGTNLETWNKLGIYRFSRFEGELCMTILFQLFKIAIARVGENSSSTKQFLCSGFLV